MQWYENEDNFCYEENRLCEMCENGRCSIGMLFCPYSHDKDDDDE